MSVRLEERAGYLWRHDSSDHLDHALDRAHMVDACRRDGPDEPVTAACGHVVRVQDSGHPAGERCRSCADTAPRHWLSRWVRR